MSVTNTQLIHRTVHKRGEEEGFKPRRFLLPTEAPEEDMGLVLRLDGVKDGSSINSSVGTSRPTTSLVPAKMCGHTNSKAVAQWALFTWVLHVHKVSDWVQKLLLRLLPVFLYMSLLVGAVQALGVMYLLTRSVLPPGAYFLLSCIGIMGYCYGTTVPQQQQPGAKGGRRGASPSLSQSGSEVHLKDLN